MVGFLTATYFQLIQQQVGRDTADAIEKNGLSFVSVVDLKDICLNAVYDVPELHYGYLSIASLFSKNLHGRSLSHP